MVWADMRRMQLPASITPVPPDVGKKTQGSLSADEWRTFVTHILPVTLIGLWGNEPPESRERQILDNFMNLVAAIKISAKRITSPERREAFLRYMHEYLVGILDLYPGTTITQNQHKSLHIADRQERLGPAHVTWAFSPEAGNGQLQKIKTNNKICTCFKASINSIDTDHS